MASTWYNLNDFENIIFNGIEYSLPGEVIRNLLDLKTKMGINNNQKPQQDRRKEQMVGTSHNKFANEKWKPPIKEELVFKKTEIVNTNASSFEKDISTIRVSLNKISVKNYDTQSLNIITIIELYLSENNMDALLKIANTIFDISSSNTFLSELNAKLYKELIDKSPVFYGMVDGFIDLYSKTYELEIFRMGDAENRNKQNDKRKAMTKFIVNLMKQNVISLVDLLKTIVWLFEKMEEWIECDGHTHEVDEIAENVFLFITMTTDSLKAMSEWDDIYDKICAFGEMKPKEKPSLSSRALFKFKDLLDFL
jgi:hypothetical protein